MGTIENRKKYLFKRYYHNTASGEEIKELFLLLDKNDTEELHNLISGVWEETSSSSFFDELENQRILENILANKKHPKSIKLNFQKISAIAAVLLIPLVFGLFFYFAKQQPSPKQNKTAHREYSDINPATKKAILTFSDGRQINLDDSKNGIVANQKNVIISKNENGKLVYRSKNDDNNSDANLINTLTIPKGGHYELVLPDGTKVWLNAASELKFPVSFSGTERRVSLSGEAYFEVAKNPNKPFIVSYADAEVKVLGTHFNIKAYADDEQSAATLLEGAIHISDGSYSKTLKPDEQAIIGKDKQLSVLTLTDTSPVIAWKNNYFQFTDAGIKEVMKQVSRWYNVEVVYQNKIPLHAINGKISRNVKLSRLLEMLGFTGINFQVKDKTIIINN